MKDDPTNKSKSFREIYIDKLVNDYEKIKSPNLNTLVQDYFRDLLKIKFGKVNKSGKIPDLKTLLIKQDNNNIKSIYEKILTTLQTDHQLSQDNKVVINRNNLIKTLQDKQLMTNHKDKFIQYLNDIGYKIKDEPNNKPDIIYNDLTNEQLLGLYKKNF